MRCRAILIRASRLSSHSPIAGDTLCSLYLLLKTLLGTYRRLPGVGSETSFYINP